MPSDWLSVDNNFPRFGQGVSLARKVDVIQNYLFVLVEQLRYTLRNLDLSNMNQTALSAFGDVLTGGINARLEDDEGHIGQLLFDAERLLARMEDAEGNIAQLELTATGLSTRVSDAEGNISTLTQTARGFETRVSDAEGNISSLIQTAQGFETRVSNAEGDISTLMQTAQGFETRVANAEGDISSLVQTAQGFEARVANAEGDLAQLALTVAGLGVRVASAEGDVSQLSLTAEGLALRVSDAEGDISSLSVTAQGLTARVISAEGDISSLSQTADEISSLVADHDGRISTLKQTVEGFSFSVSDPTVTAGGSYVTMTISMGGNTWRGVVAIDGNVDVSGSISASQLYANYGDVVHLFVDSLTTTRRIPLYLAGDTRDDDFIRIQDRSISFLRGTVRLDEDDNPRREQAYGPGGYLFWEQNLENAVTGSDGYPYVNGQRVFTTTLPTDWPVYVYSYRESQRLQLMFDEGETYTEPVVVFGNGYGAADPSIGKAFIRKTGERMGLWLKCRDGVERGIMIYDPVGGTPRVELPGFHTQQSHVTAAVAVLPAGGWAVADRTQTVSVRGVRADFAGQVVTAVPAPDCLDAAGEARVRCVSQEDGALTFRCGGLLPDVDLTFHILLQNAETM